MRKLIFVALLLIASIAILTGCHKEDDPQDTDYGSVIGVVTDFASGNPVNNANVQLRPSGETTLTGTDGTYEFKNLPEGKYSITVSKAEYTDLIDDFVIDVKKGKVTRRDVQIKKLPTALRVIDSEGNDVTNLDFGAEADVTSRTFSIFNDGTQTLTWWVEENCNWIADVKSMITGNQSGRIEMGRQEPIKITIDRSSLGVGLQSYILNINSDNGSKELLITAGEEVGLPSLSTDAVSNITSSTVTFNGTILNPGMPTYTERGFVYSTSAQPTINNNIGKITSTVNDQASYSANVSGINPNYTYYVRAYAVNEIGIAYGNDVIFTTNDVQTILSTSAVTNIGSTSAKLNGTITVEGSPAYTERGFCYRMSSYYDDPTISDNKTVVSGSGTGEYSIVVNGLDYPTDYSVRAYVIQRGQPIYGNTVYFTTNWIEAQVNTSAVTNIASNSATFNGSVTNAGSPTYTERGFCYTDNQWTSPTISDNKIIANGYGYTGNFNMNVTGLESGTTYYVRAYVIQDGEEIYGNKVNFTTTELPEIYTLDVSNLVSQYGVSWNVTFNGYIEYEGFPAYVERGFCYGEGSNPTGNRRTVSGTGTGYFSKDITGLQSYKTYYVRAYAKTASGEYVYGENVSFQTIDD